MLIHKDQTSSVVGEDVGEEGEGRGEGGRGGGGRGEGGYHATVYHRIPLQECNTFV